MIHWYDFLARLGLATAAGALIGVERQWRSRGAGLRTNTLVATGAAIFVLISHMTPTGSNPTQVTAYVVSGVGFLGGGVIISDGVSIRGLNSAATLWCAAAIGALSATGFLWEAGVTTAAILAINILLRPLGRRIDRQPVGADSEVVTVYRLDATTRSKKEAHIRALVLQAIAGHGYLLRAIESADVPDTDLVEVRAELVSTGRDDHHVEAAAGRLGLEPSVTAVRWRAIEDAAPGD